MNFFETAMAVNLGVQLASTSKRKEITVNHAAFIDPMPVSLLSDDPFIAIDQMDLWREGKREEAIALKNK